MAKTYPLDPPDRRDRPATLRGQRGRAEPIARASWPVPAGTAKSPPPPASVRISRPGAAASARSQPLAEGGLGDLLRFAGLPASPFGHGWPDLLAAAGHAPCINFILGIY